MTVYDTSSRVTSSVRESKPAVQTCLRIGVLGAAAEWKLGVAINVLELVTFPSLESELVSIFAIYVFVTMRGIDALADRLPLGYVY